jgi:hypothetical protein
MIKTCFIHYYATSDAPGIFTEIVDALFDSGLFAALDCLYLSLHGDPCFGPSVFDLSRTAAKLRLCQGFLSAGSVGESSTLMYAREYATNSSSVQAICYLHTKGATNNSEIQKAWRRYMLDFVVFCWRNAEDKLRSYHLWGVNWSFSDFHFDVKFPVDEWQRPYGHFMGNFWWARSDYLANLPLLNISSGSRYLAEVWVGLRSARVFNAMRSPMALPDAVFSRDEYLPIRDKLLLPTISMEIDAEMVRDYGARSLGLSSPSADAYRHDPSWDDVIG